MVTRRRFLRMAGAGAAVIGFDPLRRVLPEPDGSDWVFLFDILTSSLLPGPSPAHARRMLSRNRQLYDQALAAGATRYPIGSLDFTETDWRRQYGPRWEELVRRKRRFDPDAVLTPGPGIFG